MPRAWRRPSRCATRIYPSEASAAAAWADAEEVAVTAVTAEYPGGLKADGRAAEHAAEHGGESERTDTTGGDELPEGWAFAIDPTYQTAYYFHEASGRTQWERPEGRAKP